MKILRALAIGAVLLVTANGAVAGTPQTIPVREPLSNVPTGACVGFADGDKLTFTTLSLTLLSEKSWQGSNGTTIVSQTYRLSATTRSGYSYTLDASLHFYGAPYGDFQTTGQASIRRSDRRTIRGDASIYYDHLGGDVYRLEWLSGVGCKN